MNIKKGDIYYTNETQSKIIIDSIQHEKRVYFHLEGDAISDPNCQIMSITRFMELVDLGIIKIC